VIGTAAGTDGSTGEVKGTPPHKFVAILVRNSARDAQVVSFHSVD